MRLFPSTQTSRLGNISAAALVAAAFVIFGLIAGNGYLLAVGTTIAMTSIAVVGLTLVIGRAGQLNFGQAGFMGIGAYSSAYVTRDWHFTFLLGMLAAMLVSGFFGVVVGIIALRLRGSYLAMATLAFGAIVYGLLSVSGPLGGPDGFTNIPAISVGPVKVHSALGQYIFVGVVVGIVYLFSVWLLSTRVGRELAALRDDEVGAMSLGIRVVGRKVEVFAIGAVLAGMAGSIDAALQNTIDPNLFAVSISLQLFLMVVLGGMGSVAGAVFGTALVLGILQVVPGTGDNALMVMGVAVVFAMALWPGGLSGVVQQGCAVAITGLSRVNAFAKLFERFGIGPEMRRP